MKFKLDEHLSGQVALVLRAAGHEAASVVEEGLGGADDGEIAARIVAEGRALVTLDLDFSDVRAYPPGQYAGIIVIRSKKQGRSSQLAMVRHLLPLLNREPLAGRLWIAEPSRVRIVDRRGP